MIIGEERPLLPAREVSEDGDPRDSNDATPAQDVDASSVADSPIEWPNSFKWLTIALISFMAFTVTFACLSIMPSANRIIRDLGHGKSNKAASVLLITVWELGEAAGPLFIAPLSETFGRYAVLNASNLLFLVANVMTALSTNVPLLITMRAVTGFAVASNVLNPAIIGDMLVPEQRGKAMTIIVIVPMIASALGPTVGGAVADGLGWRQVVWINVVLACVCQIPLFAFFKETYRASTKQGARATQCNDCDEGSGAGAIPQATAGKTAMHSFWNSAIRPASILCSSRVLVMLCLCHSLDFVFYYVMVTTLPDILQNVYGQSLSATGLTFIYFTLGSGGGLLFCNVTLDKFYKNLRDGNQGQEKPEFRLPLAIVGAFGVPVAVLLYGWTASLHLPLIYLRISLLLLGMSTCFSGMSVYTYVVDAFGAYSASAMAGVIVMRSVMGAFVPLITVPLINAVGYGRGFTALSLASLSLAPIPILVMRYGAVWRLSSKFTRQLAD
ncbi:hypothetical protein LLEC1_00641 [Akanthomyces lecanii]|uniref:Major facilitator superfamily (MFS) profile domain-containing protein n=1 Tax=Cordyceps confragosa TaxID=2714763 RepID=A0A179I210_CORDF|nr:hypothetical protein LLEC1_00641 [Akanthomyces lecanii]